MKLTQRTTIRLERYEKTVFGRRVGFRGFCETCGKETEHLTVAQVAVRSERSERTVFQLTESGSLHSVDSRDGQLLICAGQFE
ncbi:MAG: hypothetical protein IPN69_24035 [Acidobacteria bacterium]|nr:hypothetical protein [Acidobacteriota bacterium]MBK8149474.1 hypothetical protein [Acidobacteriota bacterium]MBK8813780.1 hypothetical protein [Acidobacteriota bacterium]